MKRLLCILLILVLSVSLFGAAFSVSAADIDFDGLRDVWDADTSSNYGKVYSQATSLTLDISASDGWDNSKALRFSVSDTANEWANYAQIVPDVTDWYGAEYLYFYVRNYTGNLNLSLVSAGAEYKLKNGVSDAAGRWNGTDWDTVKTGSSWHFLQVGTNYTGWLRIKLTSFAGADGSGNSTDDMPASALTSIGKVMFSVSGLKAEQYPMSVCFDKFMVSGGSFVPENAPAGLRGVWDFDDLTEGTEYIGSSYRSQASITPVAYNDGLAMQWQCLNMDWVGPQKISLKTADFSGASELWFWVDISDWTASTCRIGVGVADADGVAYVPGDGNNYSYSSVRIWYYSAAGAKVTSNLSSWGWIKTLPANYSGWVGISLTDLAALMSDKKFDCTRVNTLYLGLDDAKGNKTDRYIVDNFCINSDPNGLHVSDADKAAPLKLTVTMPENPASERNFTWHTNGWTESDVQVVPAEGKTAETVTFGGADTLSYTGEIVATQYGAYVHNAKADGLVPGAKYFFRVGDAALDVWSAVGSFVTDDADDAFRFIYLSDMQTGTSDAKKTLYTLQKAMETAPDAEFFMNTGDLINNPGNNSEYLAVLGEDGAFAFANQTTAIVAGNHDYYSNDIYADNILRNHFYLDQPESSNSPSGIYYSFNYGNIHFVALNANSSMYADLDAAQIAWLKEDLSGEAAQNADFRVVMMHRGVFTAGPHYYYYQDISSLTKQMPSIMAEYDVDLVFQGHDHIYALTEQIAADGSAVDSVTSYVWSDGAGAYIEAMNQNENPVYFIGGTAGTKYEPTPVKDAVTGEWTIPATSSNALGKYTMNVSQEAMTDYLAKFRFAETPANDAGRSQSMFHIVSVSSGQLVVDSYTVDNLNFGECKYYNSFALDNSNAETHTHDFSTPVEIIAPSCTAQGCTVYSCSCGKTVQKDFVPALGHDFVDGSCSRCGAKDPDAPIEGDPFSIEVWDIDAIAADFDNSSIHTHYNDSLADGIADAVIEDGKGYDGSAAFGYVYDGVWSTDKGDNNLNFTSMSGLDFVTDWSGADYLWFWIDNTEYTGATSLRIFLNWTKPTVGAPFYTWDGEGKMTEAGAMIDAWGNAGFGKLPLPANYQGFIAVPLDAFTGLDVSSIGQLLLDLNAESVDTDNLPKTAWFDEFWVTSKGSYPLVNGCTHANTETIPAVPASCVVGGYTEGVKCADCGEILTAPVEIAALGHDFVDGVCSRCGAEDPNYVPPTPVDPCEGYTDINRSSWYHSAADYVIKNGYMGSTKTDKLVFEPNTKVSRAMVASIMYRIAGSPDVEYKGSFTDVPSGKWFTAAIEWAAQNGLASGKGAGKFDPNGNVTRQELAVFMYKLSEHLGNDVTGRADLSEFADAASVPSWAKSFVEWAVDAGLISGKSNNGVTKLAPVDNATRAEFASIIMRFMCKPV